MLYSSRLSRTPLFYGTTILVGRESPIVVVPEIFRAALWCGITPSVYGSHFLRVFFYSENTMFLTCIHLPLLMHSVSAAVWECLSAQSSEEALCFTGAQSVVKAKRSLFDPKGTGSWCAWPTGILCCECISRGLTCANCIFGAQVALGVLFLGFILSPVPRLSGVHNIVQQAAVLILCALRCVGKWPIGSPRWSMLRWVRSWWVKPSTSMDLNCRRYGKGSVGKKTSTKWPLSLTSVLFNSARKPWSKLSFKQATEQRWTASLFMSLRSCSIFIFFFFSFQDRGKRLKLQQFIVRNANSLFDLSFTEGQTEARKVPGEEGMSCQINWIYSLSKFVTCSDNQMSWLQTAMLPFLRMRPFSLWTAQVECAMFSRYDYLLLRWCWIVQPAHLLLIVNILCFCMCQQNIKLGNIVIGTILSKTANGLMVKVLSIEDGDRIRFVGDLQIKVCSVFPTVIYTIPDQGLTPWFDLSRPFALWSTWSQQWTRKRCPALTCWMTLSAVKLSKWSRRQTSLFWAWREACCLLGQINTHGLVLSSLKIFQMYSGEPSQLFVSGLVMLRTFFVMSPLSTLPVECTGEMASFARTCILFCRMDQWCKFLSQCVLLLHIFCSAFSKLPPTATDNFPWPSAVFSYFTLLI